MAIFRTLTFLFVSSLIGYMTNDVNGAPVCHRPVFTNPYAILLNPDQPSYTNNYALLQLTCNKGHTSYALPSFIYCYPDGTWDTDPAGGLCYAECNTTKLIDDDIQAIDDDGTVQTVFNHGTTAKFECRNQGQFSGSEVATCSNGTLDYSSEPICLAYCPINPQEFGEGLYYDIAQNPVMNETDTLYYRDEDVITYRCSDGYEGPINCTSSDCTSTCDDGTWDPPDIPACVEINECDSNPCQNNAACANLISEYTCQCLDGFNGTNCENNIDDCVRNECQNGATCVDGVDSYECQCPDGYNGTLCERDIDECSSDPCQNGGICTDLLNGFNCTCAPGYMGYICDEDIDDCENNECQNGATCLDKVDSYECQCQDGYSGTICENDIDECSSEPCGNGATCTDLVNGFNCTCAPGYMGVTCEKDIDDCENNECQNGATCLDEVDSYECQCQDGYSGTFCENDIDECSSEPCGNGATCTDLVNGFSCTCAPGYMGDTCEKAPVTCPRPTFTNPYAIVLNPDQQTYQVYYPLELTCEEGHTPSGLPSTIYCRPDGMWSDDPTEGLCIASVYCHRPIFTNPHAIILIPDQPTYQVYYPLELSCKKGYTPSGLPSPIFCQPDGAWSNYPTAGLCIAPVTCHRPTFTNPYAIILEPDQPTYQVYYPLELTCKKGHTPSRLPSPIYCSSDGTWSNYPTGGLCIAPVTCPRPTFTNQNAIILTPDQPTYQVYYPLELTCEEGHTPSGLPSPIYCNSDGTWSSDPTRGFCIG